MITNILSIGHKHRLFIVASILTAFVFLLVHYNLYQRIGAFGCFDDCHTITSAYFMTQGRELFSEIFYNHQVIMPTISFAIQSIVPAESLYTLIALHRLFVFAFSAMMAILLAYRFRWSGVLFILLYEPIKFYIFGDRFLPESLTAYLAAFLIGLVWTRLVDKKLTEIDMFLSALFAYAIVFLREPYIPMGILLYAFIIVKFPIKKMNWKSIGLFVALSLITLVIVPFKDYIYTVFIQNLQTTASMEASSNNLLGVGMIRILLYPFVVVTAIPETFLGQIQFILSLFFIIGSLLMLFRYKNRLVVLAMWVILASAAVRMEPPGTMFYEAFHMIPWYGLLVMNVSLIVVYVFQNDKNKLIRYVSLASIILLSLYAILSPRSFIYEDIDSANEFNSGYVRYQTYSDIISAVSIPDDTLYIELWDDVIYWQTGLDSSYKYAMYTPWTKSLEKYDKERLYMFANNPPDIYYCSEDMQYKEEELIPSDIVDSYFQLTRDDEPICVYLHANKFNAMSKDKWESLKTGGIYYIEN